MKDWVNTQIFKQLIWNLSLSLLILKLEFPNILFVELYNSEVFKYFKRYNYEKLFT